MGCRTCAAEVEGVDRDGPHALLLKHRLEVRQTTIQAQPATVPAW